MFSIQSTPLYDFNSFANYLNQMHRLQMQEERQRQLEQSRPKIVKKVESEDCYQIQIFKRFGNFDSYEVKVLRANSHYYRSANVINLVIESKADNFRKVFQFSLDDIEVSDIDWEYFRDENVLVLNIPKKNKVCCDDLAGTLISNFFGVPYQAQDFRGEEAREEQEQAKEAEKARQEQAREAETARQEKAREAELARREAEEKARQEAEKARQEAERRKAEKARQEAEKAEKARRVAELRAKKEAEVRARKAAELKKQQEQFFQQQHELFKQLFGDAPALTPAFGPFGFPFQQPKPEEPEQKPEHTQKPSPTEQKSSPSTPDPNESDDESIASEAETESTVTEPESNEVNVKILKPKEAKDDSLFTPLHKHPSIEEVEDEEFVMFRKKFGK